MFEVLAESVTGKCFCTSVPYHQTIIANVWNWHNSLGPRSNYCIVCFTKLSIKFPGRKYFEHDVTMLWARLSCRASKLQQEINSSKTLVVRLLRVAPIVLTNFLTRSLAHDQWRTQGFQHPETKSVFSPPIRPMVAV